MDRRLLFGLFVGSCVAVSAVAVATRYIFGASRSVVRDTSLGRLRVPLKQLEDVVTTLGRQLPGVARLRVRIARRKHDLHVTMKVRLQPETMAGAVLDRLRQLAVTSLESMLGHAPGQVRLDVTAPDARLAGSNLQQVNASS